MTLSVNNKNLPSVIEDMVCAYGGERTEDFHLVCKSWNDLFNRVYWVSFEKTVAALDWDSAMWWTAKIDIVKLINPPKAFVRPHQAFTAMFRDLNKLLEEEASPLSMNVMVSQAWHQKGRFLTSIKKIAVLFGKRRVLSKDMVCKTYAQKMLAQTEPSAKPDQDRLLIANIYIRGDLHRWDWNRGAWGYDERKNLVHLPYEYDPERPLHFHTSGMESFDKRAMAIVQEVAPAFFADPNHVKLSADQRVVLHTRLKTHFETAQLSNEDVFPPIIRAPEIRWIPTGSIDMRALSDETIDKIVGFLSPRDRAAIAVVNRAFSEGVRRA